MEINWWWSICCCLSMPNCNKKRKTESSEIESQKCTPQICILHVAGIDNGQFTSFRNTKGGMSEKLTQLHKVRAKRLAEPPGSTHRMNAVCGLIPDTLDDVDPDVHGYHRKCYQRFHANLNRLKHSETSPEASTSGRHTSPRKPPSAVYSSPLFPPECIFCEKMEIKVNGKTERPIKFASWKHKESACQQIEPQALALGRTHLYRQVQGKDLHAVEAQCHPYCRARF